MQHPRPRVTPHGHARQWTMIPMAPETDSRLDIVALSWRGTVLGAGDTCCWSDRPLWSPIGKHSIDNPTFVEGNRCCRYPHDARDAVADTHAPGFPCWTKPRRRPAWAEEYEAWRKTPGWHKRSNVLKLFTKVHAAQGPWPCCTSGMAETHAAAEIAFDRFIATYRAKYPGAALAAVRKRRDAKDRRVQRVRWHGHFLAFSNLMPPRVMGLCLAKFERCQVSNSSILMEAGICFHACWCR